MKTQRYFHVITYVTASIILAIAFTGTASPQNKRPLKHTDYDAWRSINTQTLSRNGEFLAYALFPQDGDGEVVVRNLRTGVEWRQPAGARPEPGRPDPLAALLEDAPPTERNITIEFSSDNRTLVFTTFPLKADVVKAKKEKKKADDIPKGGLVIMELAGGTVVRIADIKNFQLPDMTKPEAAKNVLAYLREAKKEKPAAKPADDAKEKDPEKTSGAIADDDEDQAAVDDSKSDAKKKEYGTELVLRNLADGSERTFQDVLDYKLSKDGTTLVYTVSAKKEETDGIYAVNTADASATRTLLSGRGKYLKMAWDEPQSQVAFLSDRDDATAKQNDKSANKQTKFKLYRWERNTETATEIVIASTSGFRENCEPSDKGNISFSRDGKRIFFGCKGAAAPEKETETLIDDEKVNVDLWNWRDDYIQPMQKVRAEAEKARTFRCVYHIAEKKMVQLADTSLQEITPNEDGSYALGGDDRAYRPMQEYDTRYNDSYIVDTRTGEKKLIVRKHINRITWSPTGKYAIYFDGKDWQSVSVPDGKTTNLTANLGVNFFEDIDRPEAPPAHGLGSWTRDGKFVLVYDEFDVWRVAPDGSGAVNLTRGFGRKEHLIMRYVRTNTDNRDPDSRWIDPSQPILLRAVNKDTRDSGIFRTTIDATTPPQKLLMAAKNYSSPVKAKNADVYILTESTFQEFPDYLATDSSFSKLQKVTDANPQISQFTWGTSEMVHFKNTDGVELSGILYKPENFDPNKKYPMLVYIYEKLSDTINNFVVPQPSHRIIPSFYVSNGYLVLLPDIVYTIGQPGQSALKCVLPAIQSVVDRGFVDEKAIGIQGHSWGGYQIAYMITQTDRFRAVAAGAPVSNMTSAYDGIRWGPGIPRQFQYEHTQSRIGGTLWEKPLNYIENSPLFSANRVHTPLLMIHNDADDAVPWYQGIEYYLALRRLGKEVYMFTYNGEPHGLRRRADQKDYSVRLQQFFDHFLKGAPEPEWMTKGIPYLDREKEKEKLKEQTGVY